MDLDWFQVVISCDYSCSRTGYLRGGGRQNPDDLARAAAKKIVVMSEDTVLHGRIFSLALAGEDTPQTLYRLLAQPPYVNQLPWSQMHFFWGDERCVSLDVPESNYGQVRRTILVKDLVPEGNIHRIRGELEPTKAAQDYAVQLRTFAEESLAWPRFSLVLLGLGADGHTASLFPNQISQEHT